MKNRILILLSVTIIVGLLYAATPLLGGVILSVLYLLGFVVGYSITKCPAKKQGKK